MKTPAPAAFAARAVASAPKTWIASKLCAPELDKHARQVDDRRGPVAGRSKYRGRKAHIRLHQGNLARHAIGQHVACKVRAAAGHAHAVTTAGETAHHMAANEARSANHRYQLVPVQQSPRSTSRSPPETV